MTYCALAENLQSTNQAPRKVQQSNISIAFGKFPILQPTKRGFSPIFRLHELCAHSLEDFVFRATQSMSLHIFDGKQKAAVRFEIIAGFGFILLPTGAFLAGNMYVPVATETHFDVTVCLIKYLFTVQTGAKF